MKYLYLTCIFYILYKITNSIELFLQVYYRLVLTSAILKRMPAFKLREWPLNIIHIITKPYFRIFKKVVPEFIFISHSYLYEFAGVFFLARVIIQLVIRCNFFFCREFKKNFINLIYVKNTIKTFWA